ncbi:hypothetical protein Tco_0755193 [Tanacetum coccineum]
MESSGVVQQRDAKIATLRTKLEKAKGEAADDVELRKVFTLESVCNELKSQVSKLEVDCESLRVKVVGYLAGRLRLINSSVDAEYVSAVNDVLKKVSFLLLEQLEALKDSPIELLMSSLTLEGDHGDENPTPEFRKLQPVSEQKAGASSSSAAGGPSVAAPSLDNSLVVMDYQISIVDIVDDTVPSSEPHDDLFNATGGHSYLNRYYEFQAVGEGEWSLSIAGLDHAAVRPFCQSVGLGVLNGCEPLFDIESITPVFEWIVSELLFVIIHDSLSGNGPNPAYYFCPSDRYADQRTIHLPLRLLGMVIEMSIPQLWLNANGRITSGEYPDLIAFATTDLGPECMLQDPSWISLTTYSACSGLTHRSHGSKNDFRYKTPPITAYCLYLIFMARAFFVSAGSVPSVRMSSAPDPSRHEDPSIKRVYGSGVSSSTGIPVGGSSSSGLSTMKSARIWPRMDVHSHI